MAIAEIRAHRTSPAVSKGRSLALRLTELLDQTPELFQHREIVVLTQVTGRTELWAQTWSDRFDLNDAGGRESGRPTL